MKHLVCCRIDRLSLLNLRASALALKRIIDVILLRRACFAATRARIDGRRMLVGSSGIVFGGTKHASIPDLCAV